MSRNHLPGHLRARQGRTAQGPRQALRKGRAARRPRNDGQCRRPRFREPMVMISERPADVADRAVPGPLGGRPDLRDRQQERHRHARERATRYTILLALPDGHDAEHVQQAIIDKMGRCQAVAQLADLGPGRRARPAPQDHRRTGHAGLLLRPAQPMAARHQ